MRKKVRTAYRKELAEELYRRRLGFRSVGALAAQGGVLLGSDKLVNCHIWLDEKPNFDAVGCCFGIGPRASDLDFSFPLQLTCQPGVWFLPGAFWPDQFGMRDGDWWFAARPSVSLAGELLEETVGVALGRVRVVVSDVCSLIEKEIVPYFEDCMKDRNRLCS